jgi:polyisoprenyl-teichoic acid--peptidoglycan teichoic acid transferase
MARPPRMSRLEKSLGVLVVTLLCILVAVPAVKTVRISTTQADFVATVFDDEQTQTIPTGVTEEDPWAGQDRVNVLLLGGDGGVGRTGIRTDSMILLSMDTHTGKSVMFSLPRNMMNAQFPADSPLHDVFPYGFSGEGDPGTWMLNAVYKTVPELYPAILGDSENEGADAIKQAVAGSLGTNVDYYLLINLLGFQQLVDAIGGVTVNVNEPVAINGNTDAGIPPTGYIEPGPDQHLDGFHALWFSRGRWGSDDYERMLRQRCMVDAIIDEADPLNVLRRYEDLAKAGEEILRTDIPRKLMPAFVDLALRVKEKKVKSIAFVSSDKFFSGDPDFAWMQSVVAKALGPKQGGPKDDPGTAVKAEDACGYHPEA